MFDKILVPQDGSDLSRGIAPWVAQIAKVCGSQADVMFVSGEGAASGLSAALREHLVQSVATLQEAGIEAQLKVAEGPPADAIVSRSDEGGYDLIAMSTHGRSGVGRWVYGSTTDKVLQAAILPLLVARSTDPPQPAPERTIEAIIVALDGSELAESALPTAKFLAKEMGARMIVVRVVPTLMAAAAGEQAGVPQADLLLRLREDADEYAAKMVAQLNEEGIQTESVVVLGDAAGAIIETAEGAGESLVVIMSRGRTGLKRWIMGSVADRVLRASYRPVLLLRPPEEDESGS